MDYQVNIAGVMVTDDNLKLDAGPITGAWWEVPLPPCPDCGGDIVWCEFGHVPGTRKCVGKPIRPGTYQENGGCGSMFNAHPADGRLIVSRERFV